MCIIRNLFIGFIILLLAHSLSAQVVNDKIERRLSIQPDQPPSHSSSKNCTVDWKCVSAKAVTRCMIFHNDQWFQFTTQQAGTYYLNVSNQNCRDINGVQVLVIDGTPCEPATYQYLICQSNGTQDDIAITLEGLKADYTYLVNIDGYLNDNCQFDIQISSRRPEFALIPVHNDHKAQYQFKENALVINWQLPRDLEGTVTSFYLLRRHASEKRFKRIGEVSVVANAYGKQETHYSYKDDSLRLKGVYQYKIIGVSNTHEKYVINELTANFNPTMALQMQEDPNVLTFTFTTKKYLHYNLYLYNADNQSLLLKRALTTRNGDNFIQIGVRAFLQQGISNYRVEIRNITTPDKLTETFWFYK